MSPRRTLLALCAAGGLIAAGCGDDADDSQSGEGTEPDASSEVEPDGSGEEPDSPQPDDGVAASVGSTEITSTTVDGIYDELSSLPQVEQQLEGDQEGQMASMLRSQIVSRLVVQEVVVQAAEADYGIEITPDDLDARMDELTEEVGGDDALDAQLAQGGLTRGAFEALELELTVAFEDLQAEFGVESPTPQGEELSDEEQELQDWSTEKLQEADVSVAEDYGAWNAETGQVEPEGMPEAPAAPGGTNPPAGSAPPGASDSPEASDPPEASGPDDLGPAGTPNTSD